MRKGALVTGAIVLAALAGGVGGFLIGHGTRTAPGLKPHATTGALPPSVPRPDFATALPRNYRVTRVLYARLSGGTTPDAVVASIGPPSRSLGLHPADLQVLVWDPVAKRWNTAFDAQKVNSNSLGVPSDSNSPIQSYSSGTPSPILDTSSQEAIAQIGVAQFTGSEGPDLVFSTYANGGAGSGVSDLSVVNLANGAASDEYDWSGSGQVTFRVAGHAPHQVLLARAQYWTIIDPDCCPTRIYRFEIGWGPLEQVADISDDRPFLGLYVSSATGPDGSTAGRVVSVVPHSPAAGRFHVGDLVLGIAGAKKIGIGAGPVVVDELAQLKAGTRAIVEIERGSQRLSIGVTLGSIVGQTAVSALLLQGNYSRIAL
jgi:hypothetical protein